MPLYEYSCAKCHHLFEELVFNSDPVACPHCRATKVERLLSVPAKPRAERTSLPTSCDPKLPPCGPGCCRL